MLGPSFVEGEGEDKERRSWLGPGDFGRYEEKPAGIPKVFWVRGPGRARSEMDAKAGELFSHEKLWSS